MKFIWIALLLPRCLFQLILWDERPTYLLCSLYFFSVLKIRMDVVCEVHYSGSNIRRHKYKKSWVISIIQTFLRVLSVLVQLIYFRMKIHRKLLISENCYRENIQNSPKNSYTHEIAALPDLWSFESFLSQKFWPFNLEAEPILFVQTGVFRKGM